VAGGPKWHTSNLCKLSKDSDELNEAPQDLAITAWTSLSGLRLPKAIPASPQPPTPPQFNVDLRNSWVFSTPQPPATHRCKSRSNMKMLSNGILCPSSALLYPILSQEQSQSTAGALLVKIPIITSPCTNARAGLRTPGGDVVG
jgi:hypothetical protein